MIIFNPAFNVFDQQYTYGHIERLVSLAMFVITSACIHGT